MEIIQSGIFLGLVGNMGICYRQYIGIVFPYSLLRQSKYKEYVSIKQKTFDNLFKT